jgi:SAM-dependent methyltransferase
MDSWRAFWSRPNRIYVNDRHLAVHYRQVADDILGLAPGPDAAVLDYGCGEALDAGRIADAVRRLYLFDITEDGRHRLRARHGAHPRIEVIGEAELDALPGGSLDLIVVNSVLQYLSVAELRAALGRFRALLGQDGRLVLADVLPPDPALVSDALSLLRTALNNGFLGAAMRGLVLTFFSDYRRMRRDLALSTYRPEDLLAIAGEEGFSGARRPRNFGFNQRRMAFVLQPVIG